MKAILFEAPGSVPICTDVELAKPRSGEIEVTITAAGVCHSDLHVVSGDWDIPTPVVLGHELSGVVSALGPGVTDLSIGDHVVLSGCRVVAPAAIASPVDPHSARWSPRLQHPSVCFTTVQAGSRRMATRFIITSVSPPLPSAWWCPCPGRFGCGRMRRSTFLPWSAAPSLPGLAP